MTRAAPGGPKQIALAKALRSRILDGDFVPHEPIESEVKLAEFYGVSRGTIRQALATLERDGLLIRMPGKGTYVNPPSQRERIGRISVVIDSTAGFRGNFCLLEIIEGIREAAGAGGLGNSVSTSFVVCETVDACAGDLRELTRGADGVLSVSFSKSFGEAVSQASQDGPAWMNFFGRINNSKTCQIYVNQAEGAAKAVSYLLHSGHRRIGLVVVPATAMGGNATELRITGYCQALESHGLSFEPDLVRQVLPYAQDVEDGVRRLLDRSSEVTGIIIGGGVLTYPVVRAIQAMHIDIPRELSVIAFDDTSEAQILNPPLSVIKQPLVAGAMSAFQQLLAMIRQSAPRLGLEMPLSPELVIRDSCMPPKVRQPHQAAGLAK